MHVPLPDVRWRHVSRALKTDVPPEDPLALRVYLVKTGKEKDDIIRRALDIIEEPEYRDTVIVYYLCEATPEEISGSLRISLEVLEVIKAMVCDMSVFEHKMELIRYIRHFGTIAHDNIKQHVEDGLNCGPSYLINHFKMGHEQARVNRDEMLNEMAALAYNSSRLLKSHPTPQMVDQFVKLSTVAQKSIVLCDRTNDVRTSAIEALVEIATQDNVIARLEAPKISLEDVVH